MVGRPRKQIDESKILETCKNGATITGILVAIGDAVTRETLSNRIREYVQAGKLVWAPQGKQGRAGILKTP